MINNVVLVGRMTVMRNFVIHQVTLLLQHSALRLTVTSRVLMVNVKLTLLTVLSGASRLKIWLTGLRKVHWLELQVVFRPVNYENQQGQRVYVIEVVADNFQMWKAVRHVKVIVVVHTTLEDLIIQIHSVVELPLVVRLVNTTCTIYTKLRS